MRRMQIPRLLSLGVFSNVLPSIAYGKPGNLDPEPEPESRTGTGTGEINECFKLGSMININTPPSFSTFLARWMMVLGD